MTYCLFGFLGFFGGKGSYGLGDWVVVLVGCAVFGETGAPARGANIFFCFAMQVGLAPTALHIVD